MKESKGVEEQENAIGEKLGKYPVAVETLKLEFNRPSLSDFVWFVHS